MAKNRNSKNWLRQHQADTYVKRSVKDGYRSRAIYKLIEIDERDQLIKPGQNILDLGAAPGGWSEWAAKKTGLSGRVVAVDILSMAAIPGVINLQLDLQQSNSIDQIRNCFEHRQVDLVLSDMAPNLSGVRSVDQARAMHLAELALESACELLGPGGKMLIKVFQGSGFDQFRSQMLQHFQNVKTRKPQASRPKSREIYLLGSELVVSTPD